MIIERLTFGLGCASYPLPRYLAYLLVSPDLTLVKQGFPGHWRLILPHLVSVYRDEAEQPVLVRAAALTTMSFVVPAYRNPFDSDQTSDNEYDEAVVTSEIAKLWNMFLHFFPSHRGQCFFSRFAQFRGSVLIAGKVMSLKDLAASAIARSEAVSSTHGLPGELRGQLGSLGLQEAPTAFRYMQVRNMHTLLLAWLHLPNSCLFS